VCKNARANPPVALCNHPSAHDFKHWRGIDTEDVKQFGAICSVTPANLVRQFMVIFFSQDTTQGPHLCGSPAEKTCNQNALPSG
jgi:hypothetical protein